MTDRPIIFSGPMVRALLDGRKTMTRRLAWNETFTIDKGRSRKPTLWQRVQPGDRLWVRETWRTGPEELTTVPRGAPLLFECDDPERSHSLGLWGKARSPIHMPRWASRLTLIVTATKIEPLQNLTDREAEAEGVLFEAADPPFWYVPGIFPHSITAVGIEEIDRRPHAIRSFAKLWNYLHGASSWDANPEVVALTLTVHQTNIDALPQEQAA